jgi:hypothetical protein
MRKIMLLAAALAMLGMGPQLAQARDQGAGGRHFSTHAGVKFHRPHHGFEHRRRGFFGPHQGRGFFGPHHGFEHHGRGFFAKPRHFRNFGHQEFVFRFGDYGGFVSEFRPLPRFRADHFQGWGFKLRRLRPYAHWHHRGFGKPWHAQHRKTPNR